MFTVMILWWLGGSLAMLGFVALARRRRGALARELHELRGALTAARLAVDLMPVLNLDRPGVCQVASDELERSYGALGDFERLLHSRLVAPTFSRSQLADAAATRRARKSRIDAHAELERLALIWGEATRRCGREFSFEWEGPRLGIFANGPKRPFVEVVANLLANAIRHGEGDVELCARVRSDSLRIEVSDQGPGLPGPLAGVARRSSAGPHGHGLSIARESARRLGGNISSAPSPGGAKLVFTVPALHDSSAASEALLGSDPLGHGSVGE
ncbi:MAG: sensor histidine kinase [Solirubrobacterales bacterium]